MRDVGRLCLLRDFTKDLRRKLADGKTTDHLLRCCSCAAPISWPRSTKLSATPWLCCSSVCITRRSLQPRFLGPMAFSPACLAHSAAHNAKRNEETAHSAASRWHWNLSSNVGGFCSGRARMSAGGQLLEAQLNKRTLLSNSTA